MSCSDNLLIIFNLFFINECHECFLAYEMKHLKSGSGSGSRLGALERRELRHAQRLRVCRGRLRDTLGAASMNMSHALQ